jgi:hypothetical protein
MQDNRFIVAWLQGYGKACSEVVPLSEIKGWELDISIIEELTECTPGKRIDYFPFPLEHIVFIAI